MGTLEPRKLIWGTLGSSWTLPTANLLLRRLGGHSPHYLLHLDGSAFPLFHVVKHLLDQKHSVFVAFGRPDRPDWRQYTLHVFLARRGRLGLPTSA